MIMIIINAIGIMAMLGLVGFSALCLLISGQKEKVQITKVRYVNCTPEEWDKAMRSQSPSGYREAV